jgi:hypothetical protein
MDFAGLSPAVHILSYRTVRGLSYALYCIARGSYHIVPYCTPEEICVRVCHTRMYCIVGLSLAVHIVSYRIILRIGSYRTDTILGSCCTFLDRIKIPFSRFVFGSYPHFPRIASWFLSGRTVWNLRYDLRRTRYDPRGIIGSYSDRNAMIWYLLMELAVVFNSNKAWRHQSVLENAE